MGLLDKNKTNKKKTTDKTNQRPLGACIVTKSLLE